MENKIKTVLIVDSSINGVISRAEGSGEGSWNSPEDGLHYRSTVADIGVCIMGHTSFEVIGGKNYEGVKHYVMTTNESLLGNAQNNENVVYTNKSYPELLNELSEAGHQQVAILGGSKVYTDMISQNLIDEMIITMEPVVLRPGVKLFGDTVTESMWKLESSKHLNDQGTLVLKYVRR